MEPYEIKQKIDSQQKEIHELKGYIQTLSVLIVYLSDELNGKVPPEKIKELINKVDPNGAKHYQQIQDYHKHLLTQIP